MKNSKMKKFEEIEVKDLSSLNQTEMGAIKGGLCIATIADGWFDGSFFGRLFDGISGNATINEFDKCN